MLAVSLARHHLHVTYIAAPLLTLSCTYTHIPPQPCMLFVGEKFESVPGLKVARSMLLDLFRGEQVSSINLAGVDRVIVTYAVDDAQVWFSRSATGYGVVLPLRVREA